MASILAFLTVSPGAGPGIVLAICFYAAYAGPPLSMYGSSLLLIVAFVTRFLPIAFVSLSSGVRSMNPELEEAVRIHGGGRFRALTEVVAPVLKKNLLGVKGISEAKADKILAEGEWRVDPPKEG